MQGRRNVLLLLHPNEAFVQVRACFPGSNYELERIPTGSLEGEARSHSLLNRNVLESMVIPSFLKVTSAARRALQHFMRGSFPYAPVPEGDSP